MPILGLLSPPNLLSTASFVGLGNVCLHLHGPEGAAMFVQCDSTLPTADWLNGGYGNQRCPISLFQENLHSGLKNVRPASFCLAECVICKLCCCWLPPTLRKQPNQTATTLLPPNGRENWLQ